MFLRSIKSGPGEWDKWVPFPSREGADRKSLRGSAIFVTTILNFVPYLLLLEHFCIFCYFGFIQILDDFV